MFYPFHFSRVTSHYENNINSLVIFQSQKISEILLDVKVSSIFYCQRAPSRDTASVISQASSVIPVTCKRSVVYVLLCPRECKDNWWF